MRLYLVRHGKALPNQTDSIRPLSEVGIKQTQHIAALLGSSGLIKVPRIYHSAYLRSKQTAEIFASHLTPTPALELMENITPYDSPEPCLNILNNLKEDTILVGHQPHLSIIALMLLTPEESNMEILFDYTTVICLQKIAPEKWCIAPLFTFNTP